MVNNDKDWVSFLADIRKSDRIAAIIGIIIILIVSVVIIYIATWQAAYASQFYEVKFKINFLEGIQTGIKIRYQGGVTIGEITRVESNYNEHYLHAIIRNDFKIIKYGTKITVKDQGAFGSSYLDVSTIPYYFSDEAYAPSDIIQVSEIVPFQVTLNNFNDLFAARDDKESIVISKLLNVKSMIYDLSVNRYTMSHMIRSAVHGTLSDVQKILQNLQDFNSGLFKSADKLNKTLNNTANNLRKNLPVIKRNTQRISNFVLYKPKSGESGQYMHDEQVYYSTIIRLNLIKSKIGDYKDFPYKMIFESGL